MGRQLHRLARSWIALALAAAAGAVSAQPRDYVYVAHVRSVNPFDRHAAIAVVDPGTSDFVNTLPMPSGLWTVSAQPDGSHVFVTSLDSTEITVIDTVTDQVDPDDTISVGFTPWQLGDERGHAQGVLFQPHGTLAFVVGGQPEPSSWVIRAFDTTSGQTVGDIQFGANRPLFVDFSPDGAILFVSEFTGEANDFLNAYRAQPPFDLLGELQLGNRMGPPAVSPAGDKILVPTTTPPVLNVVSVNSTGDLLTLDRTLGFPDEAIPVVATFAPSGEFAYVAGGPPHGDPPYASQNVIWEIRVGTWDLRHIIGDGSFDLSYVCCQFSPNSMLAYARFNLFEPAIHLSRDGLVQINTRTHEVGSVFRESSDLLGSSAQFAVTSDGRRAVFDQAVGTGPAVLFTVNLDTMQVQGETALDDDLIEIAISTHAPGPWAQHVANVGSVVYVADSDGISIINGHTLTRVDSLSVQSGAADVAFALTPDSFSAYAVPNPQVQALPINLEDPHMHIPPIQIAGANGVGVSADGSCAFVTSNGDNVSVINTIDNSVNLLSVGRMTNAIAVTNFSCIGNSGSNPRAYASAAGGGVLYIDLANPMNQSLITGFLGQPERLATTPDGRYTYVTTNNFSGVYVIDSDPSHPDTFNTIIGRLEGTGFWSRGVATSPDSLFVYVADRSVGRFWRFPTGSLTSDAHVDIGAANGPWAIALTADGGIAFVTNFDSASVSVIRTLDMTIIGDPIPVGRNPVAVAAR